MRPEWTRGEQPPRRFDGLRIQTTETNLEHNEKLLYTKRECALMLSLSARTIDNLIATKQLRVRRIGRRVLVHRETLTRFATGNSGGGNLV
jgi:excisionase family DNA binding protein